MRQTKVINHMTKCDMKRAMQILDKSEGAIRKGMERGQIPYRRLGPRQLFFFEEELFGLLESAPGVTLEQLAAIQKVRPLVNPSDLEGGIPPDTDVDAFLEDIYQARK